MCEDIAWTVYTMDEGLPQDRTIPKDVEKSSRAVLLSTIGGVPLGRFQEDYRKLTGSPLEFKNLGFSSLRECLEAMPNAVRFQYSEEAKLWMLYGIGEPNYFMTSAAKKAQYPRPNDGVKERQRIEKGRKKYGNKKQLGNDGRGSASPSNQVGQGRDHTGVLQMRNGDLGWSGVGPNPAEGDRMNSDLRVMRNKAGLYSVCVKYTGALNHADRPLIMDEITELFAEQGDVIQRSTSQRFMFFRFQTEEEAINVIRKYHGRRLKDNVAINVVAAMEKNAFDPHESDSRTRARVEPVLEDKNRVDFGADGKTDTRGVDNPVDIVVLNLHKSVRSEELLAHFKMFGPLKAKVCTKHRGGDSSEEVFGTVSFSCIANAHSAQVALDGSYLINQKLKLETTTAEGREAPTSVEVVGRAQTDKGGGSKQPHSRNKHRNRGRGKRNDKRHNAENNHIRATSEDESCDSITPEIEASVDAASVRPDRCDSPTNSFDAAQSANNVRTSDRAVVRDASLSGQQEGSLLGRGRGTGHLTPAVGRGYFSPAPEVGKKKLRPSLADLIDRVHEL